MSVILIRRNQLGRTPTRGKSYARPLSSGMEIINFTRHAGRWTPILRDLSGISFARVRGVVAGMQHPGHRTSFLFSGLSRFQACKQSSRGVCQCFQVVRSFRSPVCKYETGAVQGVGNLTQANGNSTHERH